MSQQQQQSQSSQRSATQDAMLARVPLSAGTFTMIQPGSFLSSGSEPLATFGQGQFHQFYGDGLPNQQQHLQQSQWSQGRPMVPLTQVPAQQVQHPPYFHQQQQSRIDNFSYQFPPNMAASQANSSYYQQQGMLPDHTMAYSARPDGVAGINTNPEAASGYVGQDIGSTGAFSQLNAPMLGGFGHSSSFAPGAPMMPFPVPGPDLQYPTMYNQLPPQFHQQSLNGQLHQLAHMASAQMQPALLQPNPLPLPLRQAQAGLQLSFSELSGIIFRHEKQNDAGSQQWETVHAPRKGSSPSLQRHQEILNQMVQGERKPPVREVTRVEEGKEKPRKKARGSRLPTAPSPKTTSSQSSSGKDSVVETPADKLIGEATSVFSPPVSSHPSDVARGVRLGRYRNGTEDTKADSDEDTDGGFRESETRQQNSQSEGSGDDDASIEEIEQPPSSSSTATATSRERDTSMEGSVDERKPAMPVDPIKKKRGRTRCRPRVRPSRITLLESLDLDTLKGLEDELYRIYNDEVKVITKDKDNTFNRRHKLPSVKRVFIKTDEEGNDYIMQKTLPHRHKDISRSCVACLVRTLLMRVNGLIMDRVLRESEDFGRTLLVPEHLDLSSSKIKARIAESKAAQALGKLGSQYVFSDKYEDEFIKKVREIAVENLGFSSAINLFEPFNRENLPEYLGSGFSHS